MSAGTCEQCGRWRDRLHRFVIRREELGSNGFSSAPASSARRSWIVQRNLCLDCAEATERRLLEAGLAEEEIDE